MSGGNFRERLTRPLMALLREGVTPEKLALSVALGAALGVFPVLGTTTALCAVAAWVLRLNLPAIQVANFVVYPLQVLLIVPFSRLGGTLLGDGHQTLSRASLVSAFDAGLLHAFGTLWGAILHAVAAWAILAPVLIGGLYALLLPLFRRMHRRPDAQAHS